MSDLVAAAKAFVDWFSICPSDDPMDDLISDKVSGEAVDQLRGLYADLRSALASDTEGVTNLQSIIHDLAPWCSAGLDDPQVCDELKAIFKRVLEADCESTHD